ncbi:response regulator [Legionella sp. CNM-4043-24]|uniref:response regulator n=1 Tax=Legionella sp. CNM-4043-24 TaxID=3421646 RepID=UPI00403B30BE
MGLPDISGFDVVRHLRFLEKEDGRIRTPVIGLTAHSVQDTEQEALQSGMNEVLSKPLRPEYINDLIKKYDLHQNLATEDVKKIETPRKNLTRHDLPENAGDMFQLEQFALLDEQLGMENCGGFESLKELLGILINFELPGDKEKMQEAFRQKNYADVEKLAHKIKGGAVYVGTVRMKYACQYVERYWKTGERELFDTLYHQAISVIDETYRHINIWLDKQ